MATNAGRYTQTTPLNERRKLEASWEAATVEGKITSLADIRRLRFLVRLSEKEIPAGQDAHLDATRSKIFEECADALQRVSIQTPETQRLRRRLLTVKAPVSLLVLMLGWIITDGITPLQMIVGWLSVLSNIVLGIIGIVIVIVVLGWVFGGGSGPVKKDGTPDMRYRENR